MDALDTQLIGLLGPTPPQRGRLATVEGFPQPSPTRITKLEDEGIIVGYTVRLHRFAAQRNPAPG